MIHCPRLYWPLKKKQILFAIINLVQIKAQQLLHRNYMHLLVGVPRHLPGCLSWLWWWRPQVSPSLSSSLLPPAHKEVMDTNRASCCVAFFLFLIVHFSTHNVCNSLHFTGIKKQTNTFVFPVWSYSTQQKLKQARANYLQARCDPALLTFRPRREPASRGMADLLLSVMRPIRWSPSLDGCHVTGCCREKLWGGQCEGASGRTVRKGERDSGKEGVIMLLRRLW